MTEANHLMHVIRPDAPDLADNRADTCTSCHKNSSKKDRAARLQEWQSTFTKNIDSLQADMKAINAAMKEKASLATADMRTKVRNVQANLTILTRDGSRGAHNFSYAQKIMAQAGKDLEEVKTALK
jgi:hypothetical protein